MATERNLGRSQVSTALLMGVVLALVGLLGYVLVGGEGQLLGLFGVNGLHNAFHVLSGLLGLLAGYAASGRFADEYNQVMAAVYLLLFVLGLVFFGFMENLLNVNTADNLLHLGLGLVFAAVGFGLGDRS